MPREESSMSKNNTTNNCLESISHLWLATCRCLNEDHNDVFPKSWQNKAPFQSSLFSLSKELGNIKFFFISLIVKTDFIQLPLASWAVSSHPQLTSPGKKGHRTIKGAHLLGGSAHNAEMFWNVQELLSLPAFKWSWKKAEEVRKWQYDVWKRWMQLLIVKWTRKKIRLCKYCKWLYLHAM